VRRYPLVVLMPVIVLVAAGVTLGLRRSPVYTASTQMNVGVTDANSQATPGYAEAAQELASSYSRQAVSRLTAVSVARTIHSNFHTVLSKLSAPTVPDSPTFYIDATGASSEQAVRLSNITARALQAAVDLQERRTGANVALAQYTRLQKRANTLNSMASKLKAKRQADPAMVTAASVDAADLSAQVAALQAQAQSEKYTAAYNTTTDTNLEILNPARTSSSDRATYLERYGIVGLVAGLVIGVMFAFLVALIRQRSRPKTV
jgi:capsular polysaccharide biosynthesis protein